MLIEDEENALSTTSFIQQLSGSGLKKKTTNTFLFSNHQQINFVCLGFDNKGLVFTVYSVCYYYSVVACISIQILLTF